MELPEREEPDPVPVTEVETPNISEIEILPPPFEWIDIPAGQVTLEHDRGTFDVFAFTIAKYPITYAQFQVFIDAPDGFYNSQWRKGLVAPRKFPKEQEWKIADHPRERVSWYDAIAFCRWLSHKTGLNITLPTEQQWQRAAQGDDNPGEIHLISAGAM